MEGWAGFTDDDLKKLQGGPSGNDARNTLAARKAQMARQQKMRATKKNPERNRNSPVPESKEKVSQSMLLSMPPPAKTNSNHSQQSQNVENQALHDDKISDTVKKEVIEVNDEKVDLDPDTILGKELGKEEFVQRELGNAEKFQIQQNIMKEQNKRKTELLAQAITERQKKTKAEACKLRQIQLEVSALDKKLTADVTIIRDRIESVSREYVEAQKRYEKAENEFIEAKIELHQKSEIKESLTEHLYTIIHENELRKARKLTDLMEKLQMENLEDSTTDLNGANTVTNLPSMTLLNSASMESPVKMLQTQNSVDKDSSNIVAHESISNNPSETNNNTSSGAVINAVTEEKAISDKETCSEAKTEENVQKQCLEEQITHESEKLDANLETENAVVKIQSENTMPS